MDEKPEGTFRRDSTSGDKDQKKQGDSFIQNSLLHHVFHPAKIVTVGFLVGALYLIGVILSNYKLALSEVDARIENYRPLNQRLDKMDWKLDALKEKTDDQNKRLTDIEDYFKAKGKR